MPKKRNYAQEYKKFQDSPTQKKQRALRNAARKKLGLKKGDPRDVDHIIPLSKGGSNKKSNLKPIPRSKNRAKKNS